MSTYRCTIAADLAHRKRMENKSKRTAETNDTSVYPDLSNTTQAARATINIAWFRFLCLHSIKSATVCRRQSYYKSVPSPRNCESLISITSVQFSDIAIHIMITNPKYKHSDFKTAKMWLKIIIIYAGQSITQTHIGKDIFKQLC